MQYSAVYVFVYIPINKKKGLSIGFDSIHAYLCALSVLITTRSD